MWQLLPMLLVRKLQETRDKMSLGMYLTQLLDELG
jgi:hypothetical protein